MGEHEDVTFIASIARITTLADGGLRVTFDLPEDAILAAAELMAVRQAGYVVNVTVEPVKQEISVGTARNLEKGAKRQSNWKAAEK